MGCWALEISSAAVPCSSGIPCRAEGSTSSVSLLREVKVPCCFVPLGNSSRNKSAAIQNLRTPLFNLLKFQCIYIYTYVYTPFYTCTCFDKDMGMCIYIYIYTHAW